MRSLAGWIWPQRQSRSARDRRLDPWCRHVASRVKHARGGIGVGTGNYKRVVQCIDGHCGDQVVGVDPLSDVIEHVLAIWTARGSRTRDK